VVRFPPSFSFVVALAMLFGFDEITAAGWLNVAFAATAVLLGACVVNRIVTSKEVRVLSLALVSLGVPLLLVSTFVLSEALFILLAMASLVTMRRAGSKWDAVVVAGIFSGLATATRYIGITLVVTGVMWIWLGDRGRRATKDSVVLGLGGIRRDTPRRKELHSGRVVGRQLAICGQRSPHQSEVPGCIFGPVLRP